MSLVGAFRESDNEPAEFVFGFATLTYHGAGIVSTEGQPVLTVRGGSNDGTEIPITNHTMTMGRLPQSDVFINEPGVSRRHAEIISKENGYYLRDLGSTNGTFVKSQNIGSEDHLLIDGDEITLASSETCIIFRHFSAGTLKMTVMQAPPFEEDTSATVESSVDAEGEGSPEEVDLDLYEGTVRVKVEAEGDIQHVVHFVQELRQKSQLRLLRMVSNSQKNVDILLGLREPLKLKDLLSEIEGVAKVTPAEDEAGASSQPSGEDGEEASERTVNVLLADKD